MDEEAAENMIREKLIKHFQRPEYIGDSVYVSFDGYHFILETNNDYPYQPSNRIALEPMVIDALLRHREHIYKCFEELRERKSKNEQS